jgi:phage repressor protein C with HTH and peptisase S24 domain
MFTHEQVWYGIDRLARERGLTASGLARRAGLDPTTFNRSKRVTKQSKPRWPSTESLTKILNATETSLDTFVALMADRPVDAVPVASHRRRCLALDQAERAEVFDDAGFPQGQAWDEIDFPNLDDPNAYALEIHGDELLPMYRDGDLLIVSPAAGIRRRDRVILKTRAGPIVAGTLLRRTAQRVEVAPFAESLEPQVLAVREVSWLGRIIWVSQ